MRRIVTITLLVAAGSASLAHAAATPAGRCAAVKIKAAGMKLAADIACARKAALKGGALDAACLAKGASKLAAVFAKADHHGGCVPGDDVSAVDAKLTACVGDLATSVPVSTTVTSPTSTTAVASTSTTSTTVPPDPAQTCVDAVNQYRVSVGLPPYNRWTAEETCAGSQAATDAAANAAHDAFGMCSEFGQNECVGWHGPPAAMIAPCLAQMWAEGPGVDFNTHGDYLNMANAQYTKVACGFTVLDSGDVWGVLDFQ